MEGRKEDEREVEGGGERWTDREAENVNYIK